MTQGENSSYGFKVIICESVVCNETFPWYAQAIFDGYRKALKEIKEEMYGKEKVDTKSD